MGFLAFLSGGDPFTFILSEAHPEESGWWAEGMTGAGAGAGVGA